MRDESAPAMNAVNRTLYIPLRGKAVVSRRGILLHDPKAEEIWAKEGFPLRGKSKSKWLAYYMGMRAAVFDDWTRARLAAHPDAVVLHLGCGLDARAQRVDRPCAMWYDVDMPSVIDVRRRYYADAPAYRMLGANVTDSDWLSAVAPARHAVVVMEGLSMYLTLPELQALLLSLQRRFPETDLLMDTYTVFAAKASRYANPIRDVGAGVVHGLDDPRALAPNDGVRVLSRLPLTPPEKIAELTGFDRRFFCLMFAGKAAARMYQLHALRIQAPGSDEIDHREDAKQ